MEKKLKTSKCMFQEYITSLKCTNDKMQTNNDKLMQYGKRLCLGIYGLPTEENEISKK